MVKHLLVYDCEWWVLGAKARIIQQYHPYLDICSLKEVEENVKRQGQVAKINFGYEVISALGLGIAQSLLLLGIRVDSAQIGSYNYITKNHLSYREWSDPFKANTDFFHRMMKASRYGAISPKLAREVKKRLPHRHVSFIRPFIDTDQFCPEFDLPSLDERKLVIGWVGNEQRKVKNYQALYKGIVKAFANDPSIEFIESTRSSYTPLKQMPAFYNRLDLLLITSSNEGGPAPAMEAYASGVPVLSTNVGYVKTVAGPKCRSLILNSLSPGEFIKKINQLKKDRVWLNELKKEARQQMVSYYTVDKTIGDWLEVLFLIQPNNQTKENAYEQ
ncbi:glycosyltransferase family 4 protein [Shouchella clausii]|uniref:Glycosyl transferase family 1 domain-containing protein n=1 Tax=Shouchella clausii (strain KSM-K16) TaxID=66692 RepID=Q5WKQ6_SHOC1|nr:MULTISPECIES: glycosyltransferase family 4 protein [Shouchella]ALA52360.1 hypothetical protein DB29_01532 [Shouchella clausii]MBU3230210.1 glycosyltransferase family 4 protein [Shouchella clausii]MBU3262591.1 glycosyltransferase family 4 protein [Shouchella clausii]MBU3507094.1 glycosyltransferase family 4 protein [Shouchella clausii]MBU3534618.1 glycosyltransferase family 4 protein [Shouchella clausii]